MVVLIFAFQSMAWSADSRVGILELDPFKTMVEFKLAGSLHTTHGTFRLKRGAIRADEATGRAEGEIVVDAASGSSGDFLRDDRIRNKELDSTTFPEIVFTPRHIDGHIDAQGNFHAKLEGTLTLHGAGHPVEIYTEGTLRGNDLIASGHLSVPYVEWGLQDPSVMFLTVAKEVQIDIATAGHVTWQIRTDASELSR
jgi:polyisoprenoid-binding protein YceI